MYRPWWRRPRPAAHRAFFLFLFFSFFFPSCLCRRWQWRKTRIFFSVCSRPPPFGCLAVRAPSQKKEREREKKSKKSTYRAAAQGKRTSITLSSPSCPVRVCVSFSKRMRARGRRRQVCLIGCTLFFLPSPQRRLFFFWATQSQINANLFQNIEKDNRLLFSFDCASWFVLDDRFFGLPSVPTRATTSRIARRPKASVCAQPLFLACAHFAQRQSRFAYCFVLFLVGPPCSFLWGFLFRLFGKSRRSRTLAGRRQVPSDRPQEWRFYARDPRPAPTARTHKKEGPCHSACSIFFVGFKKKGKKGSSPSPLLVEVALVLVFIFFFVFLLIFCRWTRGPFV